MQKYNGTLLRKFDDPVQGNASVGTSVVVRKKSDNSIAPIYSVDDVNSIQKPNPFTTDAFGRYSFFAPNGKYILQFGDGSDEIEISMVDNLNHNDLLNRNLAAAHDAVSINMQEGGSLDNLRDEDSSVLVGGATAAKVGENTKRVDLLTNAAKGFGVYSESLSAGDAKRMSEIGISYVIYIYHPSLIGIPKAQDDIRELNSYGISVVFSLFGIETPVDITSLVNTIKVEPNIIGWYLYDEPDGNGITIAQQESKLGILRGLSGLPCSIAASSDFSTDRRISKKFDAYFISRYITQSDYSSKTLDQLELYFAALFRNIGSDVGIEKLIPIGQAFSQGQWPLFSKDGFQDIWRVACKYYVNKPCFFIWSANATQPSGFDDDISSNTMLYNAAYQFMASNLNCNSRGKVTAKSMFFADNGSPTSVDSVVSSSVDIFDIEKSLGVFGYNPTIPDVPSFVGYYPNYNGFAVVDLGFKAKSLSLRAFARNSRNSTPISIEIGRYLSTSGGVVLTTVDQSSNVVSTVQDLVNIDCRYIYIKILGALDNTYNGYLIISGIQFSAIN